MLLHCDSRARNELRPTSSVMGSAVARCRLCGRDRSLVAAHIYPRAVAKLIGGPGDLPRTHFVDASEPAKRAPTGWYDATILRAECDNKTLGPLDSCGIAFLRLPVRPEELETARGVPIARRPGVDPLKLKLFTMSLLWRAAVSSRPEFSGVRLGPFEERLRQRIRDDDAGALDDFAVGITLRHDDPGELMVPPWRARFRGSGPTIYMMHLGSHTFFIKVDARPVPDFARHLMLDAGRDVLVSIDSVRRGPLGNILRRFFDAGSALERGAKRQ